MMDNDSIIGRLISEFGYPSTGAKLVAGKLANLTSPIKEAFIAWWAEGTIPTTLQIEGYTLQNLMDNHAMNPIAAFLTLDWLNREPDKARASLLKGHDYVG